MPREEGEREPVVVRDRRRIDPETGRRRVLAPDQQEVTESMSGTLDDEVADAAVDSEAEPAEDTSPDSATPEPEVVEAESGEVPEPSPGLQARVDELTADVKRVSAEYANYRKRVERDREGVVAAAKAHVVTDLLTVLDDVERAEAHGDLTGAFKAVADKLLAALTGAGLEPFGAQGDEFDPAVHQAVQHDTSPEVTGPTVTTVLRRGYRFGERVLRPAMVGVTDHEPAKAEPEAPESPEIVEQDQEHDREQEPEQSRKQDEGDGQEQEQQAEQEQES